jgi:hypothetical protein
MNKVPLAPPTLNDVGSHVCRPSYFLFYMMDKKNLWMNGYYSVK